MKLDRFILRPVLSTVISILVVILGVLGLVSLPIEQYPNMAPPTIMVSAAYTGANSQNDGKNYIITSGLSVGDRFVVNGVSSLQDGMDIKPVTEAQYAEKLKKTEELGAAQGDLKQLKKAFGK